MITRTLSGLVTLLLFSTVFAGSGEVHISGGRAPAMGTSSVATIDFWSVCNNQAGNAWATSFSAGFSFENQFLIKELCYKTLGMIIPFRPVTLGIVIMHSGAGGYNEIKAGISLSRKFGKRFSAGVQFDYLRFQLSDGYGSRNLISCEAGFLYQVNKQIIIGVHFLNPIPVKLTFEPKEYLPTVIRIGLSYHFSESLEVLIEAEKDLTNKPLIKAGMEYRCAKPVYARIGICTNPTLFTFGFGLEFGGFQMDFASGYHPVLGFTPAGSITYRFIRKSKK